MEIIKALLAFVVVVAISYFFFKIVLTISMAVFGYTLGLIIFGIFVAGCFVK